MTNNERILGLIGLCRKSGKLTFGTQACIEAINRKKIKLIIVANDASDRTKQNFTYQCDKNNIQIRIFSKIEDLSKVIGQNNKAVLGIKEKNLSNQIMKLIDGGDVIG